MGREEQMNIGVNLLDNSLVLELSSIKMAHESFYRAYMHREGKISSVRRTSDSEWNLILPRFSIDSRNRTEKKNILDKTYFKNRASCETFKLNNGTMERFFPSSFYLFICFFFLNFFHAFLHAMCEECGNRRILTWKVEEDSFFARSWDKIKWRSSIFKCFLIDFAFVLWNLRTR